MDYMDVILKAIAFIEEHMFDASVYEDVFPHVKMSKYHFHRIFLAGTHETVGNYIKKRRLTQIGERLRQTDDKVIDVALDCQYDSHEAFTRAFKRYFYESPRAFRKSNRDNPLLRLDRIDRAFLECAKTRLELVPNIKTIGPLSLIGKRAAANFKDNQLGNLWDNFKQQCRQHAIQTNRDAYTVWLQHKEEIKQLAYQQHYDLFIGFPKTSVDIEDEILNTLDIGKGLYAVFHMKDSFSFVFRLYSYIYFTWFKTSGYELGDGYVIEKYSKDFSILNEKGDMSIWIPIKKEQ
ncbi:AraC family transcriptional regulator [Vallitalea pronyensis]|uniref:AraC family transcriptional regulator n=1 Tax=Vallitalea pronyensis TaxID=1348613 RepID=A0A8J8MJC4_9FIRM|nr:AraC family transcriptional regulator [Vallitalea pronyensis]QUI22328.1 AraC family transcriptional regulator [Vallitalea pronyensis]